MTTTQNVMNMVHQMDQNGKLVVAAIASAVLQSQKTEEKTTPKKKNRKGDKDADPAD